MKSNCFGIYGAGGMGRQALVVARTALKRKACVEACLYMVDDNLGNGLVNDCPLVSYTDFLGTVAVERHIFVAVSDPLTRATLVQRCSSDGLLPWSISADSVVVGDEVSIGPGSFLSHFCLVTCNVRIGQHFHANHYCHVAHDCVIGDYVTFASGVRCNGNVLIEDLVYIGTGAMIRNGQPGRPLRIGRGATVGMGAVVTKDVPPGVTVVGNPARPISRTPREPEQTS